MILYALLVFTSYQVATDGRTDRWRCLPKLHPSRAECDKNCKGNNKKRNCWSRSNWDSVFLDRKTVIFTKKSTKKWPASADVFWDFQSSRTPEYLSILTRPSSLPAGFPWAGIQLCTWCIQATGPCVPVVPSSRFRSSLCTRPWTCGRRRSTRFCSSMAPMSSSTKHDLHINQTVAVLAKTLWGPGPRAPSGGGGGEGLWGVVGGKKLGAWTTSEGAEAPLSAPA